MSRVTHTASADHRARADSDARQDDRAATHPDVRADGDRLAELLSASELRAEWMRRRVNLHCGAEQREIPNPHRTHVQHDAVEVEEHAFPQLDVRAVVTEERRLHPHRLAASAEKASQDASPLLLLGLAGGVQRLAQIAGAHTARHQLRVERVVELSIQHLVTLALHG
jgi:hypothetical protein